MIFEVNLSENGILVFENVPLGTEVGIDYCSWHIGPKFRGIANIPPGFHYIFFSSVDKHNQQSPRTGFFLFVNKGDVIIKNFDVANEDLSDEVPDESTKQEYIDHLPEMAECLAPYPTSACKKWSSLTDSISSSLVQRIQPLCQKIDFLTEVSLDVAGKQKKSVMDLDSRIQHEENKDTVIRFSKIPSDFPPNISPQEKTKYSMDSSFFLQQLITTLPNGTEDLFGELQFAFICFLIGQVYDAFEHWKLLVTLITNCQDCLAISTDFFLKFIGLIDIQMEEIPEDFFVDIVAQNNFLLKTFQTFFQNFECPDGLSGELLRKISMLKHKLASRFEWNFDDENEEDMPVVVEM